MGIIINIVVGIAIAAYIFCYVLKGIHRSFWATLMHTAFTAVAIVLSVIITNALSPVIAKLYTAITDALGLDVSEITDISSNTSDFVLSLSAAIAAPIVFLLVFRILQAIFILPRKLISASIHISLPSEKIFSAVLSGLLGFVIMATSYMPAVASFNIASESFNKVVKSEGVFEEDTAKTLNEINDEWVQPADGFSFDLLNIVALPIFNSITVIEADDEKGTLSDEAETVCSVFYAVSPLINKNIEDYDESSSASIKNAANLIIGDSLIPVIAGDVISKAATKWLNNEEFLGTKAEANNEITKNLFETLKNSDKNTVRGDINQIKTLSDILAEYDAFSLLKDDINAKEVTAKEGLIASIVENIYPYKRFRAVTVSLLNVAFESASDSLGLTEEELESIKFKNEELPDLTGEELKSEGVKLEKVAKEIIDFSEKYDPDSDVSDTDLHTLGGALDTAKASKIIGEKISPVLRRVLNNLSEKKYKILTPEVIDKIVDNGNYENMLDVASKVSTVVENIESGNRVKSDDILWLSENMQTSSADVISSAITKESMEEYGLQGKSAEKVATVMSGYFVNLAEADTLNDQELESETKFIDYLFDISDNNQEGIYTEEISDSQYLVDTFMNTKVLATSVSEAVIVDGKAEMNPFDLNLTENQKEEFSETLENYTKENYAVSENKDEFKDRIVAMAAIADIDISGDIDDWTKNH